MTKRVDSDALGPMLKSFGLAGQGAEETILQDGVLDQVIDVAPIVRRGRTLASSGGIFRGLLRNIHPSTGTINSGISPYNATVAHVVAPYPGKIPDQFDVWLLGASMIRFSGSGDLTQAMLGLDNIAQGFGRDDSNNPILGINEVLPLANWDGLKTATTTYGVEQAREPWKPLKVRIPRLGAIPSAPVNIVFRTVTPSAGGATFDAVILMGVFPVSLGQDGVV